MQAKSGYDWGVTWHWMKWRWIPEVFFLTAGVGAIDAATTLTGWANFAHHDQAQGISAIWQTVVWTSLGAFFAVRQKDAG
jgi:hypothetical protein